MGLALRIVSVCLSVMMLCGVVGASDRHAGSATERSSSDGQGEGSAPEPEREDEIRKYAEDDDDGPQRNFGVQAVHDNRPFATFKADRFEHQWLDDGNEVFVWDMQGWFGNDFDKLYLETEGGVALEDGTDVEEASVELLYSRNVSKFWDLQVGLRYDFEPDPGRSYAALGFQGLAPYWFEVDATAYVSEDGDVSAGVEVEYELLLTQRLVAVPRLEFGVSFHDVPEYEQWQGFTDFALGVRVRYHFRRELAPYLGLSWSRKVGETGHNIERRGGDVDSGAVVIGLRYWI